MECDFDPTVGNVSNCLARTLSIHDKDKDEELLFFPLPSAANLVSAMKGGRGGPLKLRVSWDPEVYDPIPTSMSHTLTNNNNNYSNSKKKKKNKKCKDREKEKEKDKVKTKKKKRHSRKKDKDNDITNSSSSLHCGSSLMMTNNSLNLCYSVAEPAS